MNSEKPLLIYDGDCGFCKKWIARWKKITKDHVEYAASQDVSYKYPQISREEFERAVQLIEPDGRIFSGAEAAFRTLGTRSRFFRIAVWKYTHVPGFAAFTEWVYRVVARHRSRSECVLR